MTILLIGIAALHCVVMLVLTTELVLERRHNTALADRNAVQALELSRLRVENAQWPPEFLKERAERQCEPLEINRIKRPFGLGPDHFEDRN